MRWSIIALLGVIAISRSAGQDMPLSQILIDGEGWTVADQGYEQVLDLRTQPGGEVFVAHTHGLKRIHRRGVEVVDSESRTPATLGIIVSAGNGVTYGAVNGQFLQIRSDRPRDAKPLPIEVPGLKSAAGVAVSPDR